MPPRAEPCPHCGGEDLVIKERPVVGVRDLALVGRVARILWRERRFGCRGCGRTQTEQHPALPALQRVSGRFRARLAARAAGGGAHAEIAREEPTTNGYAEGVISKVKAIKRRAYGLPTFTGFRHRVLVACG